MPALTKIGLSDPCVAWLTGLPQYALNGNYESFSVGTGAGKQSVNLVKYRANFTIPGETQGAMYDFFEEPNYVLVNQQGNSYYLFTKITFGLTNPTRVPGILGWRVRPMGPAPWYSKAAGELWYDNMVDANPQDWTIGSPVPDNGGN